MKELRTGRTVRVLFAFDRRRRAVLLIGGDKRGSAQRWYRQHVRLADRLLDEHNRRLGKEVSWRQSPQSGRSEDALNEARVETYARLMEAQVLIARAREARGTAVAVIEAALDDSELAAPESMEDRELYVTTLRRYVAALGGELHQEGGIKALFREETIALPPAPSGVPA